MRTNTRILVGTALLFACGDDATQTGGSSEGTSTDAPADTTTSSTSTEDPTSAADDADETTTPVDTTSSEGSESGMDCDAVELLENGTFEQGSYGWSETTNFFATVFFDSDFMTTGSQEGPNEGAWSVLFMGVGGVGFHDWSRIAQRVEIGRAESVALSFDFWIGSASDSSSTDRFAVAIDGDEVFVAGVKDREIYASYTPVLLDVSAYADGKSHELEFYAITDGGFGSVTKFNLDRVALSSCGGEGMSLSQGDSGTGEPTAGEPAPGTDTLGELTLCDEVVAGALPLSIDGDNTGTGNDVTGSCSVNDSDTGSEVVFEFTAPTDGVFAFDTIDSVVGDTVLYVYDACEGGTEVACNDDVDALERRSRTTYAMTQGQTVAVVVDGWTDADVGALTLTIREIGCDPAIDLGSAVPIVDEPESNVGAGDDVAGSCGGIGGEDVIYAWTPPATAFYRIDTIGSEFATALYVLSGECGDLNDEQGCSDTSVLPHVPLGADDEVFIVVDGATDMDAGGFDLSITQLGLLEGDCCAAHDSPGCEDLAVTQCFCALSDAEHIQYCCEEQWTPLCAATAFSQCDASCTLVPGEDCCESHLEAGCSVESIEACVCGFDPTCCDELMPNWGPWCVTTAVDLCFADCS